MFSVEIISQDLALPEETAAKNSSEPLPPLDEDQPVFVTISAEYEKETSVEGTLDDLRNEPFISVTIQSEYPIGDTVMSDFLVRKPTDELENLTDQIVVQREDFLLNLENAPSEAGESVDAERITSEEIAEAKQTEKYKTPKIKELKLITREEDKEKIKSKLSKNKEDKKIKEIRETKLPTAEEKEKIQKTCILF